MVITVGRQYGSGGREIGTMLAKQLGIAYYDDMLLKEAAEESGLCEELFRSFDERPKSFLYSIAMDPYSFSMNHVTPKGSIEQQVYLATYDTIKKARRQGPLRPDRPLRGLRAQGSRRRHQSLHHGSARKPHQARCRPQRHQRGTRRKTASRRRISPALPTITTIPPRTGAMPRAMTSASIRACSASMARSSF